MTDWPASRLAALLRRMPRFKANLACLSTHGKHCAFCEGVSFCKPGCELDAFYAPAAIAVRFADHAPPPYIEPDDEVLTPQ